MRSRFTTLEYRPTTGQFVVSSTLRGQREPSIAIVTEYNLRRIGDQDVNSFIEQARMFPHRPIPVVHQRRAA